MMTNLFSMFDPSTTIMNLNLSLNWITLIVPLMFIPTMFWIYPNNYSLFFNLISEKLYKECKTNLNSKKNNKLILILMSLFVFILINNFIGLFPYIFTGTSHLMINLSFAFPMWLTLLIYGWTKNSYKMLIHVVPQGTPSILIPFMVCIETISLLIRPITLSVRLTANMIAGHLLLTLLGNMSAYLNTSILPIMIMLQFLLLTLESAVSIIQAYVFLTLITLYTSEI